MKKQLFINGDLNAFQEGILPLANPTWIAILKEEYGSIKNGMKVWLYEEAIIDKKIVVFVFPGVIRDIGKNNGQDEEYEILVDKDDIKRLENWEMFKDYSTQDVINDKLFKKKYFELFGRKL